MRHVAFWQAVKEEVINYTLCTGEAQRFRVTHPFHPLFGREFEFPIFRRDWGDDRVSYRNESGSEASIPISFTDLRVPDPFVVMAAGRCRFRFEDLIELTKFVEILKERKGKSVNVNKYDTVKGI